MIWLWWNIFFAKFVYELLVMCPRACSLYTHRRSPASVKLLCQLLGPRVIRTLWAVEGLVGACWDFEGVCIGLRNNWVTDGWLAVGRTRSRTTTAWMAAGWEDGTQSNCKH